MLTFAPAESLATLRELWAQNGWSTEVLKELMAFVLRPTENFSNLCETIRLLSETNVMTIARRLGHEPVATLDDALSLLVSRYQDDRDLSNFFDDSVFLQLCFKRPCQALDAAIMIAVVIRQCFYFVELASKQFDSTENPWFKPPPSPLSVAKPAAPLAKSAPVPAATPASVPLPDATPAAAVPLPAAKPAATVPLPDATPAAAVPLPAAKPAATVPLPAAKPAAPVELAPPAKKPNLDPTRGTRGQFQATLWVGGIPNTWTDEYLTNLLKKSPQGPRHKFQVVVKAGKYDQLYAFVNFFDKQDVELACLVLGGFEFLTLKEQ